VARNDPPNDLAEIMTMPAIDIHSPSVARPGQFMAAIIDEVTRETVRSVATQLGWKNVNIREGGAESALLHIQAGEVPSFLLVDIGDSGDPAGAMAAIAKQCNGNARIVAIGLVNDVGLYRRLMEMGVSDYLVKPVSGAALSNAIQNASHGMARGEQREPVRAKTARIVAMIGARGGVGATTLAASAAWTMAQEKKLRVVLLDLDLHFGSLALSLDIEPGRGLREILSNPDRVDSLLIGAAMNTVNERLRVLGAEEPLEDDLHGGPEGLTALFADLASSTDCIVIDVPRALNDIGRHVLGVADTVGIVTDMSLAGMRDTLRLLSMIKTMRSQTDIAVIANRVGGIAGEIGRADFERGIGEKIAFSIPFDMKAAIAAAEQAKPLSDVVRVAKTAAELRALAGGLSGQPDTPKAGLLDRFRGK
jgi:pilus assembly protein CpaE